MNSLAISRRQFLQGSAAVASSLVVGFHVPFANAATAPADATPEINAWVVVKPDDTVIIRIARSEMGQGTLTGLAQLVAEELECDWARVTTEYPTPGQSAARNRPWGSFGTGGSQGIRGSENYVSVSCATPRMMLVQAAADEWKGSVAPWSGSKSILSHWPSKLSTPLVKLAKAPAPTAPPPTAHVH